MIEHLSYSSISLYGECPAKWRYRYVEKIPTKPTPALLFGSAVHTTIEGLLFRVLEGRPFEPIQAWGLAWPKFQEQDADWSNDLPAEIENMGARLFATPEVQEAIKAVRPMVDEKGPVIERRIELRVPGVPVPVIGYLDVQESDGVVGDFKTAARRWTVDQARTEMQPTFYLAALNQMGVPHTPGKFRHYVFGKSRPGVQVIETDRSPWELLWITQVVGDVWKAIEAGQFPRNFKACNAWGRRCEYWDVCRGQS